MFINFSTKCRQHFSKLPCLLYLLSICRVDSVERAYRCSTLSSSCSLQMGICGAYDTSTGYPSLTSSSGDIHRGTPMWPVHSNKPGSIFNLFCNPKAIMQNNLISCKKFSFYVYIDDSLVRTRLFPVRYFRINKFSGLLKRPSVQKRKSVPALFVRISEISRLSEPGLTNHHCIILKISTESTRHVFVKHGCPWR